jgi:hypothetical protein
MPPPVPPSVNEGRMMSGVGAIGELRIGHDRGRIRVHEDDLVAFLAQRLAGLHAGIIELAALPDHDRAGADEHAVIARVSVCTSGPSVMRIVRLAFSSTCK